VALGEADLIEDEDEIVDLTPAGNTSLPHLDEFDTFAGHDPMSDDLN